MGNPISDMKRLAVKADIDFIFMNNSWSFRPHRRGRGFKFFDNLKGNFTHGGSRGFRRDANMFKVCSLAPASLLHSRAPPFYTT